MIPERASKTLLINNATGKTRFAEVVKFQISESHVFQCRHVLLVPDRTQKSCVETLSSVREIFVVLLHVHHP